MGKVRSFCILTILTLAPLALAPAAMADSGTHKTTRTGDIRLAHGPFNMITAMAAPCDPTSPLNGLDGVWYQIPNGATHVTLAPNRSLDADLLFWKFTPGSSPTVSSAQNNDWIGGRCRSAGPGANIFGDGYGQSMSGPIPAGASYVLVNGWLGWGRFSITFS